MLELTVVSLIGVFLYGVTAVCCLFAAQSARAADKPATQIANWLAIAALFVGLMALRGLLIEDWIEHTVRQLIRDTGGYNGRRRYQVAIALFMSGLVLVVALAGYRSFVRLRSRNDTILFVANAACAAMMGLVALRLLSLHAIDRILYDFRVNWMVDIGTTMVVGACAVAFARFPTRKHKRSESPRQSEPVARAFRRGPPQ